MVSIKLCVILLLTSLSRGSPDENQDDPEETQDDPDTDSFILTDVEKDTTEISIMPGNKKNSEWLVINNIYICTRHDKSVDGTLSYWVCRFKRQFQCPFLATTKVDERGEHTLVHGYKSETHTCAQHEADVLVQKFRNLIKSHVANSLRPRYAFTYDHEKTKFLNNIRDPDLREVTRHRLPTKVALKSAAWAAREIPPAPRTIQDVDITLLNRPAGGTDGEGLRAADYLLAMEEESGVILLGTRYLAKAFSRSNYKSIDATFKICPKGWYQVVLFLAQVNGVFVTCMFCLMPRKTKAMYKLMANLIKASFMRLGLDTTWTKHFLMCDFEVALREAFLEVFPAIVILGCYFHWSQLIIRRVKGDGFSKAYRENRLLGSFIRRVCSLPFVPSILVTLALVIIMEYATKLEKEDPKIGHWALELVRYIKETWLVRYGIQDWNIFDIDCQLLPITNNGNESENGRLNTNWPTHPQVYVFLMHSFLELDVSQEKVSDIKDGAIRAHNKEMYKLLKEQREAAKDAMIEDLNNSNDMTERKEILSNYMGKQGSSINKFVDKKVAEDYNEADLKRVGEDLAVGDVGELGASGAAAAAQPGKGRGRGQSTGRGGRGGLAARGLSGPGQQPSRQVRAEPMETLSFMTNILCSTIDLGSGDPLLQHIDQHNLMLQLYLTTRSNGDCFYDTIFNLTKYYNLQVNASNPLELRRLIVASIESHPNFSTWLQSPYVWRCSRQLFREFKMKHSKPGVFTDNVGIIIMATTHALKINISVVSPSNNAQNPVTRFECQELSDTTFHCGYYQDTTDGSTSAGAQGGHYKSLIPKEAITPQPLTIDAAITDKIKTEMTILSMLSTNEAIVIPSLARLEELRVAAPELIKSGICNLLYTTIYPAHPQSSEAGKLVRKLLTRYQDTLRAGGMVGDGLDITVCPEDSVVTVGPSLLEIFTASAPLPSDSIHASVEACELVLEQEVAGGWMVDGDRCEEEWRVQDQEVGRQEEVGEGQITASISFIREARNKIDSRDVTLVEKESIIEKLRMMSLPLEAILESPLIGKTVRHFYKKMAPKQTRVWELSGKLYQDMKKRVRSHSDFLQEMEQMERVTSTAHQDDLRMAREHQDVVDDLEDSWVEPTSITILLEREEEENEVFGDASAPSSTHLESTNITSDATVNTTSNNSISMRFQQPESVILDIVRKRKRSTKDTSTTSGSRKSARISSRNISC